MSKIKILILLSFISSCFVFSSIKTYSNINIVPNIILNIKNTTVQEALLNTSIKHAYNIENNSNVKLDKLSLTVPFSENLNLERLFTGQYNEVVNCQIFYKTNYKDEFIFLSETSTNINKEIDLSVIKLNENERITEVSFTFQDVNIGFKDVESPFIFTNVISNSDQDIINKCYIVGSLGDIKKQKESSFTTKIIFFK